jgi:hypothetical protein
MTLGQHLAGTGAPTGQRIGPEWLFHALLFLPSLVMVGLRQSSMAAGLLLYLVLLCLYLLAQNAHKPWQMSVASLRPIVLTAAFLLGFVFFHAWALLGVGVQFNAGRFFGGFFVFLGMVLGAACVAECLVRLPAGLLDVWVRRALWFMLANALLGLLGVPLFAHTTHKPVGMFSEPSHFALVLGPLLAYVCALRLRHHGAILVAAFLWGLLVQNMTTVVLVLLCGALVFGLNWRMVLVPVVLGTVAVSLDVEYFLARVMISGDSDNQSVLVLLQGWESAFILMDKTHGWGAGFQQFGFVDAVGDIGARISSSGEDGLNKFDGGSTAAKLVGEFGGFGIVVLVAYLLYFLRALLLLRRARVRPSAANPGDVLLTACLYVFIVELFVRGVGYFSPTLFLALAAAMRLPAAWGQVFRHRRRAGP